MFSVCLACNKSTPIWHLKTVVLAHIVRRFRRPLGSIRFYAVLTLARHDLPEESKILKIVAPELLKRDSQA